MAAPMQHLGTDADGLAIFGTRERERGFRIPRPEELEGREAPRSPAFRPLPLSPLAERTAISLEQTARKFRTGR